MSSTSIVLRGLALASVLFPGSVAGQQSDGPSARTGFGKLPLAFEENLGQHDGSVRYLLRGPGYHLFLGASGTMASLPAPAGGARVGLRTVVVGADARASVRGADRLPGVVNDYRGADPTRWRAGVPRFARVRCEDVYPGIDLVYHGDTGSLEYDFVVAPGASPAPIQLRFEGATAVRLERSGDLVLETRGGELRHRAPYAYQDLDGTRVEVPSRFVLHSDGTSVGFALGNYDKGRVLVIDPVLVYATYLGGAGSDQGSRVVVDKDGHAILTGQTSSPDFPASGVLGGTVDVFVTKFNKDGTGVIYSTYLGGSDEENSGDIALAADGEAVAVVGMTKSTDFPTFNPFQATRPSPVTAFACRLDSLGAVTYSTYLGGNGTSLGKAVGVDATDHIYVAGTTRASNFPGVAGGFQPQRVGPPGFVDMFVARLDPAGGPNSLRAATYVGGRSAENVFDLAVGPAGSVCVHGSTVSNNFPTRNAFQSVLRGFSDAVVFVLNANLSNMTYGTLLGGDGLENRVSTSSSRSIAIGPLGFLFVAGDTQSANFPTTPGVLGTALTGGADGFVAKIDPAAAAAASIVYSTYLPLTNAAQGIAVDQNGHAHVSGFTHSTSYPLVHAVQPLQTQFSQRDAFLAVLDAAATSLLFSTPLGGSSFDDATGLTLGTGGNVYVTGVTSSADLPTTPGAFQPAAAGSAEVWLAKLNVPLAAQGNYGAGHPGSNGIPGLALSARPTLGSAVTIDVGNSLGASTPGALLVGLQQIALPTVFDGTLLVLPIVSLPVAVPAGGLQLPVVMPVGPGSCGATLFFQAIEFDPGASASLSFTPGLQLLLGI